MYYECSFDKLTIIHRTIPNDAERISKKKGYSHQQLANFLGVGAASTVFRWTNGERMPGKSNMELIKKKTRGKVNPSDFYA